MPATVCFGCEYNAPTQFGVCNTPMQRGFGNRYIKTGARITPGTDRLQLFLRQKGGKLCGHHRFMQAQQLRHNHHREPTRKCVLATLAATKIVHLQQIIQTAQCHQRMTADLAPLLPPRRLLATQKPPGIAAAHALHRHHRALSTEFSLLVPQSALLRDDLTREQSSAALQVNASTGPTQVYHKFADQTRNKLPRMNQQHRYADTDYCTTA